MTERLREKYEQEVRPQLMREFSYGSIMAVPKVDKVVLNIGLGEAIQNGKAIDAATKDLATIAGQHPVVTRVQSLRSSIHHSSAIVPRHSQNFRRE